MGRQTGVVVDVDRVQKFVEPPNWCAFLPAARIVPISIFYPILRCAATERVATPAGRNIYSEGIYNTVCAAN
jgi:hypothetical protein